MKLTGDTIDRSGLQSAGADLVPRAGKLPEALAAVDGSVSEIALVLALVDETKVVRSGNTLLEIGREEGRRQARLGIVKESQLRLRRDYFRPCQTRSGRKAPRDERTSVNGTVRQS